MIGLGSPLMPHDSLKLNISWHYQLSTEKGRDGAIDSTTFYLAYFYPRVSVYDDYKGWDTQPHTGELEFYNDFNDYTLDVAVPKNYIVWSTGTLQNPAEVLQPKFAQRLQQSMTSDSTIHVATIEDLGREESHHPKPNQYLEVDGYQYHRCGIRGKQSLRLGCSQCFG